MEVQQNFRSAFNGFNREDVVRYLEYLNSRHAAEVMQLRSEIQFLRSTPAQTEESAPQQEETVPQEDRTEEQEQRIQELIESLGTAQAELAAAQAEREKLSEELIAANEEKTRCQRELDALRLEVAAHQTRIAEELETYRRAERMERMAMERAEQVCQQVNGVLADTTVKVDDAASQVSELTERVMDQLAQLQTAVAGSKQILRDATATLFTIRPNGDRA